MVDALSRSRIDIFVQVLQIDGGQRCAAINAATLALINAGVPLRDFVCASSVGYLEGSVLVDLNSVESNMGGPELVVAMLPHSNGVLHCQADARISTLETFESMMEAGINGASQIFAVLSREVRLHTLRLVDSRGTIAF
mmetsp:Transcript_4425/g.8738  ORF Transcript_4425/g.8738 Transcript_4425/m.8738 type:complete len:139 (+) Transcript_4425:1064-1480(+)